MASEATAYDMFLARTLDLAEQFAKDNVREAAQELLIWGRTSILPATGVVNSLSDYLYSASIPKHLALATELFKTAALNFVVNN